MASGISDISSRKIIPPSAWTKSPFLFAKAPVKAPFSKPNSSLSRRVAGMAAQLIGTKGLSFRSLS